MRTGQPPTTKPRWRNPELGEELPREAWGRARVGTKVTRREEKGGSG